MTWFTPAAFVVGAAVLGCSARKETSVPNPGAAPSASVAVARGPSVRASDPVWRRAAEGDASDRARLAEKVGASELVLALDDSDDVARVALEALPFAPDADLALAKLAQRLVDKPSERRAVLEVLVQVACRPRDQNDPLDPEGARAAAATLVAFAKDQRIQASDRALAISAARGLAERGFGTTAAIPTNLDPE